MANNNDKFISRENAKTLWGYMIDLLTGKQNKLTFDDTPTQGSDNPVKSGGIFTALAGKGTYSKPQNGIPKTDLESAVQTSLGLADSALQSETDPTVPSWAKQTNKPSYTQDEVGDGTTYKRVNQTEKDTWSGKQNVLTTTQMNAVNSGITSEKVTQIDSSLIQIVDDGAKNLFNPTAKSVTNPTGFTGTITRNGDNSYTINGSTGNSVYYYYLGDITLKAGTYTLYGRPDANSALYVYDDGSWIDSEINRTKTFEATTKKIYIRIAENKTLDNYTVYPMVTTKPLYDISPSYEPHALGNQYLTPALIEQVDGGAKQLIPYDLSILKSNNTLGSWSNNVYTYNSVTFTVNSDDSISVNRSATGTTGVSFRLATNAAFSPGTYVLSAGSGTLPQNWTLSIDWSDNTHTYATSGTNPTTFTLTAAKTGNIYIWVSTPSGSFTYKPMICTLADWKVSQKHVPYCKSNSDLTEYSIAKKLNTSSVVTINTDYTLQSETTLFLQGNHLFGNLIVKKNTGNFGTSETIIGSFLSGYRPVGYESIRFSTFNTSQWGVSGFGYGYVNPTSGNIVVKTAPVSVDAYNYVNVFIDMVIA